MKVRYNVGEVKEMVRVMKERTGAENIVDAIQLCYHDEEFFAKHRHGLKLIKMLYSAEMDSLIPLSVTSLYALA